jgi:hypothetical protein
MYNLGRQLAPAFLAKIQIKHTISNFHSTALTCHPPLTHIQPSLLASLPHTRRANGSPLKQSGERVHKLGRSAWRQHHRRRVFARREDVCVSEAHHPNPTNVQRCVLYRCGLWGQSFSSVDVCDFAETGLSHVRQPVVAAAPALRSLGIRHVLWFADPPVGVVAAPLVARPSVRSKLTRHPPGYSIGRFRGCFWGLGAKARRGYFVVSCEGCVTARPHRIRPCPPSPRFFSSEPVSYHLFAYHYAQAKKVKCSRTQATVASHS